MVQDAMKKQLAVIVFCILSAKTMAASTARLGEGDITLTVPEVAAIFAPGPEITISGQVFVRTRGGETFKLSGVAVSIYPLKAFGEYERWVMTQAKRRVDSFLRRSGNLSSAGQFTAADSEIWKAQLARFDNWSYLPKAPYTTKTDADGRFTTLIRTSEAYVVFARASRLVGKETEYYIWTIPSTNAPDGVFMLSHDNTR